MAEDRAKLCQCSDENMPAMHTIGYCQAFKAAKERTEKER